MLVAWGSLKFYKLKSEKFARGFFLLLYFLFLAFLMFPIGRPLGEEAFNALLNNDVDAVHGFITEKSVVHNILSLAGLGLVTQFFSIVYATVFVNEFDDISVKTSLINSIKSIPLLILSGLIMIIPFGLSMIFLFPFLYLFYAVFFTPLLITRDGKGVMKALRESFYYTRGFKFKIFITQLLLTFILKIPVSMLNNYFYSLGQIESLAYNLISAFISAATVMIMGRFMGIYYMMSVRIKKAAKARYDLEGEKRDE